jgi:hypothetical protein
MPEQKKPAESPNPAPPPPVLGSAAASSNPVVQGLLAHRAIAVANGDGDAVAGVDAELTSLGVA